MISPLLSFGYNCMVYIETICLKKIQLHDSGIGQLVELERMPHNEIFNRRFARAKVQINVLKPLPTGQLMKQVDPNEVPVWIQCWYENIYEFFHFCCLIRHITCQCTSREAALIFLGDGSQQPLYGFWN